MDMAVPMTADQFVAALRAEGVKVVETPGWRTHNRNHKGAWGPVNGTILHHTVSRGESSIDLCYDGYSDLPGPLCHGVIMKDGRVVLVGNGRTNHAGGGDPNVLQAVIDERYNTAPPRPLKGNSNGVDGNSHFYGFECVNMGDGIDPWPTAQTDAMVRASAAISRHYGWTEKSVIGHKEWSDDKNDPRGPGDVVAMPRLRAKIAERLAHPASWAPSDVVTLPATPGVSVTKPDRQQLYRLEDTSLIPNVAYTVYWSTEGQDDGSGHGDGGKTMATNVCYSSVVNVSFTNLAEGGYVEVYAVEENLSGQQTGQGKSSFVNGRVGGGPVSASVPVIGIVANRYAIQVINRSAGVVTMTEASAASQYWPNA